MCCLIEIFNLVSDSAIDRDIWDALVGCVMIWAELQDLSKDELITTYVFADFLCYLNLFFLTFSRNFL